MDILIISHFCGDFSKSDNDRFLYLAKMLSEEHSVEIVTSSFFHTKKCQRVTSNDQWPFQITFLHEAGYPKNICLRRFASHHGWGKQVAHYLQERKTPDVLYCAVPSLTAASLAAKYCTTKHVRFIIDIQDLWPEAFRMVFDIPIISNVIYTPMTHLADSIYRAADGIVAVSRTYADRAMRTNQKCKTTGVVYLGTEKKTFDRWAAQNNEMEDLVNNRANVIRIAYVGTLGHSYDITVVLDALKALSQDLLSKIEFIVMGDGPKREDFESKASDLSVCFTGRLAYSDMVWLLSHCDIAVNPISAGAAGSIINKHMDYAMAGLPVINTQECQEYRDLIDIYQCGINCRCGCVGDVAKAIEKLVKDRKLRLDMGKKHRQMGEELFDREITYRKIAHVLEM